MATRTCDCGECKKCKHREYMRAWYAREGNAEKVIAWAKRYREENLERVQAYDRERGKNPDRLKAQRERMRGRPKTAAELRWVTENQDRFRASRRRWRLKNPEKIRAHHVVERQLRKGNLVRQPCEVCGEARGHAHHDDYAKPLEVRWLCHKHHMELNRVD